MNNSIQYMPCPVCNNSIPFNTKQLLMGVQFVCSNCNAAVGLAPESKGIVEDAMEKLEALKGNTKLNHYDQF
jgi:transcription initiation factor IIE alpha subunit